MGPRRDTIRKSGLAFVLAIVAAAGGLTDIGSVVWDALSNIAAIWREDARTGVNEFLLYETALRSTGGRGGGYRARLALTEGSTTLWEVSEQHARGPSWLCSDPDFLITVDQDSSIQGAGEARPGEPLVLVTGLRSKLSTVAGPLIIKTRASYYAGVYTRAGGLAFLAVVLAYIALTARRAAVDQT